MKKLIYNENTKEINIIEEDIENSKEVAIENIDQEALNKPQENNEDLSPNKTEPKIIKNWLEKNKIFFEIFSLFFVGIMGIILSFVGWQTNKRSADIYQKQLEIEEDNREPLFELESDLINENIEENKKEYRYTLKNEGGQISYATALIRKYVEVEITSIEGKKIIDPIIFRAPISRNDIDDVQYNEFDKNFILYEIEHEENMRAFHFELSSRISLLIDGTRACVSGVRTYIEIVYNNYQNEQIKDKYGIHTYYQIKDDKIYPKKKLIPEYDEDNIIYLNEVNKDNMESIAKQAKKEFDRRWNLEGNEVIKN